MSSFLSNRNFAKTISVIVGALGWIGLCYGTVVLVMGERGPALGLYGLVPALLSFATLAAGARLWSRFGGRASLGTFVGGSFGAAAGAIALIWVGSVMAIHFHGRTH